MGHNLPIPARQGTRLRSIELSQALKEEMALTAETLSEPLSDLKIAGYLEALSGLRVEQIRMGFRRARRTLKWFPKPSEVRELSGLEAQDVKPLHALGEHLIEWSEKDRDTWHQAMSKVAKKIGAPHMTEKQFDEHKELLRRQAAELQAKGAGK